MMDAGQQAATEEGRAIFTLGNSYWAQVENARDEELPFTDILVVCRNCNGEGSVGHPMDERTCPCCDGTGFEIEPEPAMGPKEGEK